MAVYPSDLFSSEEQPETLNRSPLVLSDYQLQDVIQVTDATRSFV